MASNYPNAVEEEVNIRVVLRCRPDHATMGNTSSDNRIVWNALSKKVGVKTQGHEEEAQQWYEFDGVFGAFTTQIEVYCRLAFPILDDVFSGYKCTVIAYGQMGTGKTFTMVREPSPDAGFTWNEDSRAGIIPRFIHHFFERLSGTDFSVKVSLFEIDNEEILDLLNADVAVLPLYVPLFDHPQHGTEVRGLREVVLRDADEADLILERAFARRKTARTPINARSSRSHVVLSVTIRIKEIEADGTGRTTAGTLNLVDLASSEDFGHEQVADERAQEAGDIHQSRVALSRVIVTLAEGTSPVPYRDSTLTRILQDSLGGTTKTTIIATVPQFSSDLEGTRLILESASDARNIVHGPQVDR